MNIFICNYISHCQNVLRLDYLFPLDNYGATRSVGVVTSGNMGLVSAGGPAALLHHLSMFEVCKHLIWAKYTVGGVHWDVCVSVYRGFKSSSHGN